MPVVSDYFYFDYLQEWSDYIPEAVVIAAGEGLATTLDSLLFESYYEYKWHCNESYDFMPPLPRIKHDARLHPNQYKIIIRGRVTGEFRLRPGKLLAMYPGESEFPDELEKLIENNGAELTREPAYGLWGGWIDRGKREEVRALGFNTFSPASVISTHLKEAVGENRDKFIYSDCAPEG